MSGNDDEEPEEQRRPTPLAEQGPNDGYDEEVGEEDEGVGEQLDRDLTDREETAEERLARTMRLWEDRIAARADRWEQRASESRPAYKSGLARYLGVDESEISDRVADTWTDNITNVSSEEFRRSTAGKGPDWLEGFIAGVTGIPEDPQLEAAGPRPEGTPSREELMQRAEEVAVDEGLTFRNTHQLIEVLAEQEPTPPHVRRLMDRGRWPPDEDDPAWGLTVRDALREVLGTELEEGDEEFLVPILLEEEELPAMEELERAEEAEQVATEQLIARAREIADQTGVELVELLTRAGAESLVEAEETPEELREDLQEALEGEQ